MLVPRREKTWRIIPGNWIVHETEIPDMTRVENPTIFNRKYIDSFMLDFPVMIVFGGGEWSMTMDSFRHLSRVVVPLPDGRFDGL